ncbi:MAG TPA: BlaI/MecI/CopY family transcriptional regulator, partial [Gemmatimonadota bacterium]|nr:BlaI/MecI/CopY family transcriptional regulator [Gemmatimonadota bacterium]
GRAYRYHPLVAAGSAGASALDRLLDKVFEGSAARLLAHLVSDRDLDPDELARMRRVLDERLGERESRFGRGGGAGSDGSAGDAT